MIKSEKAKEILYSHADKADRMIYAEVVVNTAYAEEAIEQAESELYSEEQCIEAFHIFMKSAFPRYNRDETFYKNRVRQFLSALKSKQ